MAIWLLQETMGHIRQIEIGSRIVFIHTKEVVVVVVAILAMAGFEGDDHGTILEEGDGLVIIRPRRRILIRVTTTTATRVMKNAVMGILEVEVVISNSHSPMDIIQTLEDRATTITNNSRYPLLIFTPKGEKETIVRINEEMEEAAEELVSKATSQRDTTPATADLIEGSENFFIKTSTSLTKLN